jgi:hypothetical protein
VARSDQLHRPLDDTILRGVAKDHLSYELKQMALGTFRLTPVGDPYLGNCVLEAFLVHVRVLDEFLGKGKPIGEDVLAIDYCPVWVPEFAIDPATRIEIDRRIAHLTARRTNNFHWTHIGSRHRLTRSVNRRFHEFLAALATSHTDRFAWIKPEFDEARRLLRETAAGWP